MQTGKRTGRKNQKSLCRPLTPVWDGLMFLARRVRCVNPGIGGVPTMATLTAIRQKRNRSKNAVRFFPGREAPVPGANITLTPLSGFLIAGVSRVGCWHRSAFPYRARVRPPNGTRRRTGRRRAKSVIFPGTKFVACSCRIRVTIKRWNIQEFLSAVT